MSQNSNLISSTTSSTEQVTQFLEDSKVQTTSLTQPISDSVLVKSEINSLTSICGRPTRLVSGKWSSTVSAISLIPTDMTQIPSIAEVDLPGAIFSKNAAIRDKLNNFGLFRAGMRVRLQCNGVPTQLGKLLMVWRPMYSVQSDEKNFCHNSRTGISCFPHVELDLSVGNTVELDIPFATPLAALNLQDATSQELGTIQVIVLNALSTVTEPSDASYTLWGWFTNPIATVPTAATASFPTLRDFTIGHKRYLKQEAMPIAQVMDDASSQHKTFAKLPGAGYTNCDSNDQSVNLALSRGGGASSRAASDDLTISELCKRESLIDTFDWQASDPVDGVISQYSVSPNCAPRSGTTTFHSILSYWALFASFWRGTLVYRFSCAKTIFHSGRLRISFIPNVVSGVGLETDNAYNVVWDLREKHEISLSVPFVSPRIANVLSASAGLNIGAMFDLTGVIMVSVINPLNPTDSVSTSVPINVWISSPDMKYMVNFNTGTYIPKYIAPLPQAQVLADEDLDAGMGNAGAVALMPTDNSDSCAMVTSEILSSVNELSRRFTLHSTYSAPSDAILNMPFTAFFNPMKDPAGIISQLDLLASSFTFVSGSQRLKLAVRGKPADIGAATLFARAHPNFSRAISTASATDLYAGTMNSFVSAVQNNVLEIQGPWFCNAPYMPFDDKGVFDGISTNNLTLGILGTADEAYVFRAGGNDFALSYFVGPPATT